MKRAVMMSGAVMMSALVLHLGVAPAEARYNMAKRHTCQALGTVKWTSYRDRAFLWFTNRTKSDVVISYINFRGKKRQWSRQPIKPGKGFYTRTFLTLPWIVETTAGKCVGIYEATQANRLSWATVIKAEGTGIKHACATQKQLGRRIQGDKLALKLTNQTSKKLGLYIVWKGERWPKKKPYAEIPAGATYQQPTYFGLPWMVVDEKDQCMGIWEVDAAVSRVTLEPPKGSGKVRKAEGIPPGYLHYQEQANFEAAAKFKGVNQLFSPSGGRMMGDFLHVAVCQVSLAQQSVQRFLTPGRAIQGIWTGMTGEIFAVREGGDFDCDLVIDPKSTTTPVKKLTVIIRTPTCNNWNGVMDDQITPQDHRCFPTELDAEHKGNVSQQPVIPGNFSFPQWSTEIFDFQFRDQALAAEQALQRKNVPTIRREHHDFYMPCDARDNGGNPHKPGSVASRKFDVRNLTEANFQAGCGIGLIAVEHAVQTPGAAIGSDQAIRVIYHAMSQLGYRAEDSQPSRRSFADRPDVYADDEYQIHPIYVLAQDSRDFELDVNDEISNVMFEANSHFRRMTGDARKWRLDLVKGTGQVDVSFLRLARTEREIAEERSQHGDKTKYYHMVARAVNRAGFNHPRKIYLVFFPTLGDVRGKCGVAHPGGNVPMVMSVNCAGTRRNLQPHGRLARLALHELFHALGFVQSARPLHSLTKGDLMYRNLSGSHDIDKDRDEYYKHTTTPGVRDLAKSVFLDPRMGSSQSLQLPPNWEADRHCIYQSARNSTRVCFATPKPAWLTTTSAGAQSQSSTQSVSRAGGTIIEAVNEQISDEAIED